MNTEVVKSLFIYSGAPGKEKDLLQVAVPVEYPIEVIHYELSPNGTKVTVFGAEVMRSFRTAEHVTAIVDVTPLESVSPALEKRLLEKHGKIDIQLADPESDHWLS